ncbi:type II toxin-antitoxin system prevent-host-death family antitoxin [Nocardioides sp. KC13]|uniref:Antitoxin n=1 Tax=Nocardioides turkmenicus TaxID=2711220 RepID=A0A6M1RHJ0_9ACTN|nr:type II toxin-antitoxin system prevent-host-death family antitoxin [Nocardioides sp. KC13]NGN95657.1 type II toxin-antitoxin system prevent-host-death family antitoxin [Nocardioides sp. KC13]
MSEVRVGELNQQTGRVLRRVQAGESLVVTDHGRPVAMLVPAPTSRFEQMVALGQIRKPKGSGGGWRSVKGVSRTEDLDEVLAELREETI